VPPRLLLAAKPLFQQLHVLSVEMRRIDPDTGVTLLQRPSHAEAREEDQLHVHDEDLLVAPVAWVVGGAAREVDLPQLARGRREGVILVGAVDGFPLRVVGVENLLELGAWALRLCICGGRA